MTLRRAFLWFWVGGLVLFAGVIALGLPLVLTAVPGGILDHQAAATAAEVDRIQAAWRQAGLWNQAVVAMAADLVFIGVYGVGCVLGGLYYRSAEQGWARAMGTTALVAGAIFLGTDYAETISQIIQLWQFRGEDSLAGLAAQVRPIKMTAFVVATLSLIVLLVAGRSGKISVSR